jgi:hypothetical protein
MSIIVKKVTDKNTKKQILEEYDKAMKLINELKSNLKKSENSKPIVKEVTRIKEIPTSSNESLSVDLLVDKFNDFSNGLKEDMSEEIKVIEELKGQIDEKIESIKTIYNSDPSSLLEELIISYKSVIEEQKESIDQIIQENIEQKDAIRESFKSEKIAQEESFSEQQNEFKLNSSRLEKEDAYAKTKIVYTLSKELSELVENNKSAIDDLKYEYKAQNKEAYQRIEEEQKEQKERIEKAESQKEKFEQSVNSKVTSVVTKEKNANAQAFKSMTQEYENKIKLKTTQLENFEAENGALASQIEELLTELNTVQEKAHILASKTIDAKSSTQSFEAMKDVAMEQARGKK